MRLILFFCALEVCACPTVLRGQSAYAAISADASSAEWPTFRGNNNRDGRTKAKGEFSKGANVSEVIDFSISEALIELASGNKNSSVAYRRGEIIKAGIPSDIFREWQMKTDAYLDLYGDGQITAVSMQQNVKYAQLYSGDKIYYRIEAYDGFDVTANSNRRPFVGIRVYEANTDKLMFEKAFPEGDLMQRPHVTVADMNNDGENDIVITSWEGVYVFGNRGQPITKLSQEAKGWHHLRKRGFACVRDIDGNGYQDVVIISSLPWHVDVIKNDGGVLKFGWTRIFDGFVESAKKISKPILNSVRDFDGDGSFEIFVNVYNYNDDNNWAGVLFDAINGSVKGQIRGVYVLSAEDLNNDGRYVFFCSQTKGQAIPTASALKAVIFKDGAMTEVLHIDNGEWINPRFGNTSPTVTTHWDGITSLAEDKVFCTDYENVGRKAFFAKTLEKTGNSVIHGYYLTKVSTVTTGKLAVRIPSGMYGEIIRSRMNADGRQTLLLQVRAFSAPEGTIKVEGAQARSLGRYISSNARTYSPIVADLNADGSAEILIPNDVGEVLCFGNGSDGKRRLQWRVKGRGMLWQYNPGMDYGVAADDIDHDGYKEVIVSGSNETGGLIQVYNHKGALMWQQSFPEINGGEITAFDGNIAFFGTAQSSKRKYRDVIVTVQRGIAHGGKTYCLDGIDGSYIWQLDRLHADNGQGGTIESGAGGLVFSSTDIDNDGSDEVMCGYGNIVFFADSNDGTLQVKKFMRKVFLDKYDYTANGYQSFWIQQILPVAFKNSGKLLLSCFSTMAAAGTMDTDGSLTWCPKNLDYNNRFWQCFADLDGNGKVWVVDISTRLSDGMPMLFAYDPSNGEPHKTFSVEMPGLTPGLATSTIPVAGDLDGDGRDEIVLNSDEGVYCFGHKNATLSLLWKTAVPGCGPPVVADADADGFSEILVASRDGRILVIDK